MSNEKEIAFDPYHKWLGISKAHRPVTYYQLLGVSNGESDVEVIEEAAIRQTTHLRAYQVGAHAADCTRLLNEVATARQVLVNPIKRKEYNAKLTQMAKRTAAKASATLVDATHSDLDDAITAAPRRGAKSAPARPRNGEQHLARDVSKGLSRTAILAVAGASVLLLGVAMFAAYCLISAPTPSRPPAIVPIKLAKGPPAAPKGVDPAIEAKHAEPKPDPKPPFGKSPEPPIAEAGAQRSARLIQTFQLSGSFENPAAILLATGDGRLFYDGFPTLRQFDPSRNGHRNPIDFPMTGPRGVRFAVSPNGRIYYVAVADAKRLESIGVDGNRKFSGSYEGAGPISRLALSRDGKTLVGGTYDGDVSVWDAASHKKVQQLEKHPQAIEAIAISRDGSLVASMCREMVQVWSLSEKKLVLFARNVGRATSFDFAADGHTLIFGTPAGLQSGSLKGLDWTPIVLRAAFEQIAVADEKSLVAISKDSIGLYEWPTGKKIWGAHLNGTTMRTLCLTPDGEIAFVAHTNGRLDAFAVTPEAAFKRFVPIPPATDVAAYVGHWRFPYGPSDTRIELDIRNDGGALSAQMEVRRLNLTGKAHVQALRMTDKYRGPVTKDGELPAPWATLDEIVLERPTAEPIMNVMFRCGGSSYTYAFHRPDRPPNLANVPNAPNAPNAPKPEDPQPMPKPAPPVPTPVTPKVDPVAVARLDPPTDQRTKEIAGTIRATYKADYAKKSPIDRADLAEKLLKLAAESKDDPAGRYALYCEACDVAAAAGNWPIAADALDDIGAEFKVDVLPQKEAALALLVKSDLGKESAAAAAETALQGVGAAIAADELPLAAKFLRLAATTAAKAQSVPHMGLYRKADAELKLIHAEADAVQKARETLKTMPDDVAANLAVGSYEGLRRGNWETALPLLAKGGDDDLPQLARKDLAADAAGDAAGAHKIGDDWWAAAEKQKAEALGARAALRSRAAHWYRRALPHSTGLALAVMTERLKTIEEAPTPFRLGGPANAPLRTLTGHHGAVTSLFLAPDGKRLFTGSLDGTMKSWDLKLAKMLSNYAAGQPILSLGFSPSGHYVAIGFKATMKVVEVDRPTSAKQLPSAVAFPGTYWADDNRVGYIDKEKHHIETLNLGVESLAVEIRLRSLQISPSRTQIAALGQETHLIYLNAKGSLDSRRSTPLEDSTCAAFSTPEGTVAIASLDKRIRIYETKKFSVVQTLEGDTVIQCLAFLPGGERLLSAGDDGLVRFWDTSTGKEVRRFATGSTGVMSILVTRDGRRIITGGSDGVVRVWAMPRERLATKT